MPDADPTPRERVARTVGRRGFFAALITAGGVFAVLLAQGILTSLLGTIGVGAIGARVIGDDLDTVGAIGYGLLQGSLLTDLPFAIGVFLALWQLLPIASELRFAHVVTRSLFAAGIGAALVIVVLVVWSAVVAATGLGFADLGSSVTDAARVFWEGCLQGVVSALRTWVELVPLVVLAGLLLWGWQQRFPPKHGVTGHLDEL